MFYVATRRGAAKTIARMTNYAEMVFHGKTIGNRNAKARKIERQFDLRAYGAGYTACVSKELIVVFRGEISGRMHLLRQKLSDSFRRG